VFVGPAFGRKLDEWVLEWTQAHSDYKTDGDWTVDRSMTSPHYMSGRIVYMGPRMADAYNEYIKWLSDQRVEFEGKKVLIHPPYPWADPHSAFATPHGQVFRSAYDATGPRLGQALVDWFSTSSNCQIGQEPPDYFQWLSLVKEPKALGGVYTYIRNAIIEKYGRAQIAGEVRNLQLQFLEVTLTIGDCLLNFLEGIQTMAATLSRKEGKSATEYLDAKLC